MPPAEMFGDSEGDEAFGSKDTSDIYKSMLMDQYGKSIARAGGIGIAAYVKQELLKQQEVGNKKHEHANNNNPYGSRGKNPRT